MKYKTRDQKPPRNDVQQESKPAPASRPTASLINFLATLNAIARTVSESRELEAMLSTALDTVLQLLEFEPGAIYLRDPRTAELEMACHYGRSVDLHSYRGDVTCSVQVRFNDPNPGNNSYSEHMVRQP